MFLWQCVTDWLGSSTIVYHIRLFGSHYQFTYHIHLTRSPNVFTYWLAEWFQCTIQSNRQVHIAGHFWSIVLFPFCYVLLLPKKNYHMLQPWYIINLPLLPTTIHHLPDSTLVYLSSTSHIDSRLSFKIPVEYSCLCTIPTDALHSG